MIEKLIGEPVYIGINEISLSSPLGLKEKKRIIQKVKLEYGLHNSVAINTSPKKRIISENYTFSGKISTPKDFYSFLEKISWNHYNWNHMGTISRPIELKLDNNSIKVNIDDVKKITSRKHGEYKIIFFDAEFEINGRVEYGGNTKMDSNLDITSKFERWAKQKLPKENDIHHEDY